MHSSRIIFTLAAAQLLLAMTPGPNMIVVLQSAIHDRKAGLAAVAGVWPVGLLWAAVGLAGLGALVRAIPGSGAVLGLLCGSYLVWLGVKAITRSFRERDTRARLSANAPSSREAFKAGVITNLTNPKAIAYFTSIFSATGASALSRRDQIFVMIMMPTISSFWYGSLAILASHTAVQKVIGRISNWLDRLAGLVMVGFGVGLFSALWRQWSKST